ncbi:MAG: hypothetical protein ABID87_09930 [Chloroflexota bacterium]
MILGIASLVTGVALLILAIPYSILSIISGVAQLEGGIISGGIPAYFGIIGVVIGFILTTIGATRVFKR